MVYLAKGPLVYVRGMVKSSKHNKLWHIHIFIWYIYRQALMFWAVGVQTPRGDVIQHTSVQ